MKFNEKLRTLRCSLGLTLADVANAVGVSKPTVQRWESGNIKNLRMNKIKKLADVLMCTPAYLMDWEENEPEDKSSIVRIPVFAKIPSDFSVFEEENVIDFEEMPRSLCQDGTYFGYRVIEQHMEPRIQTGDVVILKAQNEWRDGQICIVSVHGKDALLYEIKNEKTGIWLLSSNPAVKPQFCSQSELSEGAVRILGRAVQLRGKM